jgi:hypothetical protein
MGSVGKRNHNSRISFTAVGDGTPARARAGNREDEMTENKEERWQREREKRRLTGLRDLLFDEIDRVRQGKSNAANANAK